MSKTKKIDKEFVLSDSSKNVYGFKCLTSGYLLEEFLKNPIGYYNHSDEEGILVTWEDVQIDGDRIIGKPVINLSHPRGERTVQEVQDGILKGASVGDIVWLEYVIEVDPDTNEECIVLTKWYNKECSLVDKPANRNAFSLKDVSGNAINLSDLITNHKIDLMKKVTLDITPELITLLGLSDNADSAAITKGIKNLHDKSAQLEEDNKQLKTEREDAEKNLREHMAKAREMKVQDLLDKSDFLQKPLRDQLAEDYKSNPDGLEKVLGGMKAYTPVTPNLRDSKQEAGELPEKYKGKTYDDLFMNGSIPDLRDNYPSVYKQLYKDKFKKEPRS